MKTLRWIAPSVLLILSAIVAPASAASYDVKLLNRGAEGTFVFEPSFLKIAPGDTVHFIAATKGHNAETIAGMLPEGAAPFIGPMSEDATVTFDKPGVYGLKCRPHYTMGMVLLIEVGTPDNAEAAMAVRQPGRAAPAFARLWEKL